MSSSESEPGEGGDNGESGCDPGSDGRRPEASDRVLAWRLPIKGRLLMLPAVVRVDLTSDSTAASSATEPGDRAGIGGAANDGPATGLLAPEDKPECAGERSRDIAARFTRPAAGDDGCLVCHSCTFTIHIGKVWDVGCVRVKKNNSPPKQCI